MDDRWLTRLKQAIRDAAQNGRSMRSISIEAGLSVNYVDQLMKGSQPTVEKFIAICEALNKDPAEMLTGVKSDAETAKAVRMFAAMPPDQRKAFLAMLETVQPGTQPELEKNDPAPAD
jgi:lambda repressor-like predicted transcriptional regulator